MRSEDQDPPMAVDLEDCLEQAAREEAIRAQHAAWHAEWLKTNPWPFDVSASGINPSDVVGYGWMRARGD
ncbi:hypothetical protein [Gemmobacter denitrificans]|uniref:Uncharacterized protein n=1 Tax=Gemmobacter denitrificans TaxID=3123040 RepID=A0ABU8BSI5_9RHOB